MPECKDIPDALTASAIAKAKNEWGVSPSVQRFSAWQQAAGHVPTAEAVLVFCALEGSHQAQSEVLKRIKFAARQVRVDAQLRDELHSELLERTLVDPGMNAFTPALGLNLDEWIAYEANFLADGMMRKRRKELARHTSDDCLVDVSDPVAALDAAAGRRDLRLSMADWLSTLSSFDQTLLDLLFRGYKTRYVADELNVCPRTVKRRLKRLVEQGAPALFARMCLKGYGELTTSGIACDTWPTAPILEAQTTDA